MSALDSFWEITPIQDAIALLLTKANLLQCTLTSQTLANVFRPFLWHDVNLTDFKDHQSCQLLEKLTAILKYHHLIRKLDLVCIPLLLLPTAECLVKAPHLLSLKVSLPQGSKQQELLVELVEAHPSLQDLELKGLTRHKESFFQLCSLISKHPSLRNLDISSEGQSTCADVVKMLKVGTNLHRLHVGFYGSISPDPNSVNPQDLIAVNPFLETTVQDFYLSSSTPCLDTVLSQFFSKCPRLRRLVSPGPGPRSPQVKVWQILQTRCSKLEDLTLEYSYEYSAEYIATIIGGFSGLKRVKIADIYRQGKIHDAIALHHGTHLVYFKAGGMHVGEFYLIVQHCTALTTLAAKLSLNSYNLPETGLQGYENEAWNCTQLENFRIALEGTYSDILPQMVEIVFQGLGSLPRMQDISVEYPIRGVAPKDEGFMDHTDLFAKCLPRLVGLERLLRFEFVHWKAHTVKEEDVEVMVNQWPRLMELEVTKPPVSLFQETEFRRRILAKRPWLELNKVLLSQAIKVLDFGG